MLRILTGSVVSDKMQGTISVKVMSTKKHPLYRKNYPFNKKYLADDPKNKASIGDIVSIKECRPISAKKHFKLDKIIKKAKLTTESLAVLKDQTDSIVKKDIPETKEKEPKKVIKTEEHSTKESKKWFSKNLD